MTSISRPLRRTFKTALERRDPLTVADADQLIEVASQPKACCLPRAKRKYGGLDRLLEQNEDHFERPARKKLRAFMGVDKNWQLAADHTVFKTVYWPYADFSGTGKGDPNWNLWADEGCLAKLDQLRAQRGMSVGAKDYEKRPALNFLKNDGTASGYYIPRPTIREKDAERTTGVDFGGTGKLRPNIAVDFLDAEGAFGQDGKTDGELNVGWWGNCDLGSVAGVLFPRAPARAVDIEGIVFTPRDIEGLLTLLAESQKGGEEMVGPRFDNRPDQLSLKDGRKLKGRVLNWSLDDQRRGPFRRPREGFIETKQFDRPVEFRADDGKLETFAPEQVSKLVREDIEEPNPALFHKTLKLWLKQKRPFIMDHDRSEHVWNEPYDTGRIRKLENPPPDVDRESLLGSNGPCREGTVSYYETELLQAGKVAQRYRYWIAKDHEGTDLNSGWLPGEGFDLNPDFMWRPKNAAPSYEGKNRRNPFVTPALVKELYERSLRKKD